MFECNRVLKYKANLGLFRPSSFSSLRARFGIKIAVLIALGNAVSIIAGCAMMSSSLTDLDAQTGQVACHTNAGAYFLPKTMFRVGIIKHIIESGEDDQTYYKLSHLTAIRRSDGTKPYCLDYLGNITSDDEINVVKYTDRLAVRNNEVVDLPKTKEKLLAHLPQALRDRATTLAAIKSELDPNLLRYVASDALDQSSYILKALTKALFLGIAGAGATTKSSALAALDERSKIQRVIELDYDPFDSVRTAMVNDALKEFGFCIVVETGTFDPAVTTVQEYCDKPKQFIRRHHEFDKKLKTARFHNDVKSVRGILYRPRIPYKVFLFLKSDGKWKLRKSETIAMENIAPIVSVGIDRTFFAQRKTALVFDQGMLTNVCIFKTSELQKFAEVPLEIVKGVISLPTTIIQLRIINTNNDAQLVKAHEAVLRKQENVLQELEDIRKGVKKPGKDILGFDETPETDVDAATTESFFKTSGFDSTCPNPAPITGN